MKRAYLLLLALFLFSFFLTPIYQPEAIQAGGNPLNIELLSDHSLTEADTFFNIYGYEIVTSNNIAHVYWQETGNGSEGIDLFYRQIPGGSTTRLSDPTLSEGDVSQVWFDTAVAPDGTFHIIWLEDTNTAEAGDLFYWTAASGTLVLSDHTQTEGYVQPAQNTMNLILDANGIPHTIWYEETGTTEGEDLFYWNPTLGTTRLTDRTQTEGSDVDFGPNNLLIDDNNTSHITWAEYGNDGITNTYFYWNSLLSNPIITPFFSQAIVAENTAYLFDFSNMAGPITYWDSATQTTQTIPSSDDPGGIIFAQGPLVDTANTIHLLWSEGDSGVCLSHWNSDTNTTEDLVMGETCYPLVSSPFLGPNNTIHTVVVDEPMGTSRYRYWNSALSNPIEIPTDGTVIFRKLTGIPGTNLVHFSWIENSGSDDNFYHWDNFNQTTINLSQIAGSDTSINSDGRYVESSSDGELHLLWKEVNSGTGTLTNLYWNSATNITQDLFAELGIASVNNSFEEMRMDFSGNGSAYTMWYGTPDSGPDGLYLWDSAKDTVHLAGESLPCSAIGRSYKNDADNMGNMYLAWQDNITGNNYLWSEKTGQIDLSQTSASETGCQPPVLAVSENNGVFVLWIEESDAAGEGLDIFGGWIEGANFDAYLPMIVK